MPENERKKSKIIDFVCAKVHERRHYLVDNMKMRSYDMNKARRDCWNEIHTLVNSTFDMNMQLDQVQYVWKTNKAAYLQRVQEQENGSTACEDRSGTSSPRGGLTLFDLISASETFAQKHDYSEEPDQEDESNVSEVNSDTQRDNQCILRMLNSSDSAEAFQAPATDETPEEGIMRFLNVKTELPQTSSSVSDEILQDSIMRLLNVKSEPDEPQTSSNDDSSRSDPAELAALILQASTSNDFLPTRSQQTTVYNTIIREVIKRANVLIHKDNSRSRTPAANDSRWAAWEEIAKVVNEECDRTISVEQLQTIWRHQKNLPRVKSVLEQMESMCSLSSSPSLPPHMFDPSPAYSVNSFIEPKSITNPPSSSMLKRKLLGEDDEERQEAKKRKEKDEKNDKIKDALLMLVTSHNKYMEQSMELQRRQSDLLQQFSQTINKIVNSLN